MTKESHPVIAAKYECWKSSATARRARRTRSGTVLLDTLLCVTVLPAALTDDPRQLALVQMPSGGARTAARPHRAGAGSSERRGSGTTGSKPSSTPSRWTTSFAMESRSLPPTRSTLRASSPTRCYAHSAASSTHPHIRDLRFHREAPRVRCSRALRPRQRRACRTRPPSGWPAPATDPRSDVFALGFSSSRCSRGSASSRQRRRVREILLHGDGRSCAVLLHRALGVSGLVGRALASRLPIGSRAMAQVRRLRSTHACAASGREAPGEGSRVRRRRYGASGPGGRRGARAAGGGQGALPRPRAGSETRPLGAGRRRVQSSRAGTARAGRPPPGPHESERGAGGRRVAGFPSQG